MNKDNNLVNNPNQGVNGGVTPIIPKNIQSNNQNQTFQNNTQNFVNNNSTSDDDTDDTVYTPAVDVPGLDDLEDYVEEVEQPSNTVNTNTPNVNLNSNNVNSSASVNTNQGNMNVTPNIQQPQIDMAEVDDSFDNNSKNFSPNIDMSGLVSGQPVIENEEVMNPSQELGVDANIFSNPDSQIQTNTMDYGFDPFNKFDETTEENFLPGFDQAFYNPNFDDNQSFMPGIVPDDDINSQEADFIPNEASEPVVEPTQQPVGFVEPAASVQPVEPAQPNMGYVEPVAPVQPAQPNIGFVEPVAPVQPVEPAQPNMGYVEPAAPVSPVEPAQPNMGFVEPVAPVQPVEPAQPNMGYVEPATPVPPVEPVQPPMGFVEPAAPVPPVEAVQPPMGFVEPAAPVPPVEPVQPPMGFVEPTAPIPPVEPVQPNMGYVEPVAPVPPVEPVQPNMGFVEPVAPVTPVEPVVEPVQPPVQPVDAFAAADNNEAQEPFNPFEMSANNELVDSIDALDDYNNVPNSSFNPPDNKGPKPFVVNQSNAGEVIGSNNFSSSYATANLEYAPNGTNSVASIKPRVNYSMSNFNSLLSPDKKIVTFIGTSKNGTSFLVNNIAAIFSSLGINTAILDMTHNKNSYYIYTKNDENLRKISYTSIEKLKIGESEGLKVNKNLTVYTALPNDGKDYSDCEGILTTLAQNHSVVLIDCDFTTPLGYFALCQEIYLVQSLDILTIQPLTAFLRDLKTNNVLEPEKVRVVINKDLKVGKLTSKIIISGMSSYNDPSMSFMTELFNKDTVNYCVIPFDERAYSKYLEGIVNCEISVSGFSSSFVNRLKTLAEMIYPLNSKQAFGKNNQNIVQPVQQPQNTFSNSTNNTLNKMKQNNF